MDYGTVMLLEDSPNLKVSVPQQMNICVFFCKLYINNFILNVYRISTKLITECLF